jgi:diguanylate cyclase (GGDEF)-like protein
MAGCPRQEPADALAAAALEQLPDGVLVADDGHVLLANAAACRLTGTARADLLGAPVPAWVRRAHGPGQEVTLPGGTVSATRTTIAFGGEPATLITLHDRSVPTAREAELARLAHRDGLTGLLNRRAFDARLHEEAGRLAASGRPLGLVMVDLDHFKAVNDQHGHPVGDQVLAEAARRMTEVARTADSVGRLGGEEFGWLLPDATEADLLAAVQRLRRRFAAAPFAGSLPLTASIGFCDLATAGGPDALVARADEALYFAKAHGRDMALGWSPDIAQRLDAATDPRVDGGAAFARLAAAADVADGMPAASGTPAAHGARVANLAVAMAAHLDWTPDRQARLHRAARLHDVGKVALPSTLIGRPGPLTADEMAHVDQHARIGASLAARVLDTEQESWIAGHHERWDTAADALPDGAGIVAIADAWDAMTTDRVYRPALTRAAALAELERCSGRQFRPDAGDLVRQALDWWSQA